MVRGNSPCPQTSAHHCSFAVFSSSGFSLIYLELHGCLDHRLYGQDSLSYLHIIHISASGDREGYFTVFQRLLEDDIHGPPLFQRI